MIPITHHPPWQTAEVKRAHVQARDNILSGLELKPDSSDSTLAEFTEIEFKQKCIHVVALFFMSSTVPPTKPVLEVKFPFSFPRISRK